MFNTSVNSWTKTSEIDYLAVSTVLSLIISQYFNEFYCTCFIDDTTNSGYQLKFENYQQPIIIRIDLSEADNEILLASIENGCQSFILTEYSWLHFFDHFWYLHDRTVQRFANKKVIIALDYGLNLLALESIFDHVVLHDIPQLLVLAPSEDDRIDVVTNQFTGRDNQQEVILLDSFIPSLGRFLHGNDLFPDKLLDLKGRFLRLAIFNYSPYTLWTAVNSSLDANAYFEHEADLHVDGTESKIFSLFCDAFNCSLEISLDEAGEWGEIFDNRTGNGIIGAVVERRADIGVGALYSWFHEFTFLTLSKPISRTGVTCITPKPKRLSSWMTPILPFRSSLWAAVAITFVLVSIFAVFINFMVNKIVVTQGIRVDICESFMIIGSMFILQAVLLGINRNKYVCQMMLFGSVLFVGLMLGNAYSGGLSSVMTIPRYQKPIDTLQDLADSDLHWASTHDAWIFSILMATQPTIQMLVQKFETHPKEVLHRHAFQQNLAYSVERLPYGHFAIGEYIDRDVSHYFHLMIEDVYWENCVAMSTKTWPMIDHLDGLILRVFESGIQRYWELQVVSRYADNKVQLTIATSRHQESSGPTILQPSHLVGAFMLLAFGLAVGFMIFLMEIAAGKLYGTKWSPRN